MLPRSAAKGAVVYVGESHPHLPVALFAAAVAGVPYVPINYRLDDAQLLDLIGAQPRSRSRYWPDG